MTGFAVVATFLTFGLAAGLAWVWRYWAIRTWRTFATFGLAGLVSGVAVASSAYGVFLAPPIMGAAIWLAASGNGLLLSVPPSEYRFAERIRNADLEARQLLAGRQGNASPRALEALDGIISGLSETAPHDVWDQAQAAKVKELRFAKAVLASGRTDQRARERLLDLRRTAHQLFTHAQHARSDFWKMPQTDP